MVDFKASLLAFSTYIRYAALICASTLGLQFTAVSQVDVSSQIDSLQAEIERIQSEVSLKEDTIELWQEQILHLKSELIISQYQEGSTRISIPAVVKQDGGIKDEPGFLGEILTNVYRNDTVTLIGLEDRYWLVEYAGYVGYLMDYHVEMDEDLELVKTQLEAEYEVRKEEEEKREIEIESEARRKELEKRRAKAEAERQALAEQQAKEREAYKQKIYKKYGRATGDKLLGGLVWIGMTKEMARVSWGEPSDINRTIYAFGIHEQWVYSGYRYLYFEDGILTTIQD